MVEMHCATAAAGDDYHKTDIYPSGVGILVLNGNALQCDSSDPLLCRYKFKEISSKLPHAASGDTA
jgi:hypothetical protein